VNLLAIETSTDACSVALASGTDVRVDHRIAPREHARLVLPMIDTLLAEAGLARADLDGVAFGRGPGSFTGVRIAAAVTQGIALGLDIGVVGVSTLATMAQGCFRELGDTRVGVALDARLDEIYWGAFREVDGVVRACTEERVCAAEAATFGNDARRGESDDVRASPGWRLAGPGAERYADTLRQALDLPNDPPNDRVVRPDVWPTARDTLALAAITIAEVGFGPPESAVPVYLRERVALTEVERGVSRAAPPGAARPRAS